MDDTNALGGGRNHVMHALGEVDELIVMHGRSRMITDPRIPTTPGRSTPGFDRPGRHR